MRPRDGAEKKTLKHSQSNLWPAQKLFCVLRLLDVSDGLVGQMVGGFVLFQLPTPVLFMIYPYKDRQKIWAEAKCNHFQQHCNCTHIANQIHTIKQMLLEISAAKLCGSSSRSDRRW